MRRCRPRYPATGPTARSGRHANATLIVLFLSLGGLSFAVLQSLVAPALPAIAADLQSSTGNISWILTAYLLSASVLTPIFGRLGDMIGKRKVMVIVLVILFAGTLVAALSTTLPVLIAGRALQGAAGAILPLSIGIVRDELPREKVGVTVGLLSAIFGIGAGLGIVLAGPIVDNLSWEWLFWFPLVLIVVALLGVVFGVPESPVRKPGRLDVLGAGILSVSLVSLLLAISKGREWGWGAPQTVLLSGTWGGHSGAVRLRRTTGGRAVDRHAAVGDSRGMGHEPDRPGLRVRDVRHFPAHSHPARTSGPHRLRLRQDGVRGRPVPATHHAGHVGIRSAVRSARAALWAQATDERPARPW